MSGEAERAGPAFGVPDTSSPRNRGWVAGPATCRSSSKTVRVYFETQTNKNMKAAAPAAIANQACVTIAPLVRAATSGSIDFLCILFPAAPHEEALRKCTIASSPRARSQRP